MHSLPIGLAGGVVGWEVPWDGVGGGGTETRRLQGTERAYEGMYTFGTYKRVGGQTRSVKDQCQNR